MTQITMTNQQVQERVNHLIATTKPDVYPESNTVIYTGNWGEAVVITLTHNYICKSATYFDEDEVEYEVESIDTDKVDIDFTDGMNGYGFYQPEAA